VRRRILVGFLTLTAFVLAVLEIPLGLTYADHQRDELATQLERDAFSLASVVEERLEDGATTGYDAILTAYERRAGARAVVVDATGLVVGDTEPDASRDRTMRSRPEIASALRGEVATGRRHSDTLGTGLLYVAVPVASGGEVHGVVRLTYTTSQIDERVRRYWIGLGQVALGAMLAAAALGTVIARSVARPLSQVERAAVDLGRGRLDVRAEVTGPAEVRSLAESFNDMATRLGELVDSQEAFVADASHQLRTPLTALRLRLENIADEGGADVDDDVDAALADLQRLGRMVDGLLALARADRDAGPPASTLDLVAVAEDRRATWATVGSERDVSIDLDVVGAAPAWATEDRVVQVLDNLLANALDASPPGARIVLEVTATDGSVDLHVIDEGVGLSAEDRTRAFDRFWRGPGRSPSGTSDDLGGTGLGLSIVKKLVIADGGTIRLDAGSTGGVDAVVRYRRAP
jgi:signal transduction histidine kinase